MHVHHTDQEPRTELDPRFSDAEATATDWATTRALLEGAELSWLTTVRADGRPHVTPLVAVWLDGALHFCTGQEEQKARNLASRTAVVLTTGCAEWEQGIDVVVEGTAERVVDPALLERLATAWTTKWDGSWRFEATDDGFWHEAGGAALVFRVQPTTVFAFAKGTFGHTRHVFAT